MNWKDLRIAAINKLSKKKGWAFSDRNPYFDEWIDILKTKASSKREFILEKNRIDNVRK